VLRSVRHCTKTLCESEDHIIQCATRNIEDQQDTQLLRMIVECRCGSGVKLQASTFLGSIIINLEGAIKLQDIYIYYYFLQRHPIAVSSYVRTESTKS
jgi:hypothetical protein